MSKSKKIKRYVILSVWYDYRANKYVWYKTSYTREQLVSKIALREVRKGTYDSILDNLVDSMDNIEYGKYFVGIEKSNEIVKLDMTKLSKEIDAEIEYRERVLDNLRKSNECRRKLAKYTFRKGPVPNIHKCHYHRGSYYRHPKLKSVRKSVYDNEYKEFIKGKDVEASGLVWDDRVRHTDKCWKTSFKVRKQWQKHLR